MSKELAILQDLKSVFVSLCLALNSEDKYIKVCENKFDIIEAELKENEYKTKLLEKLTEPKLPALSKKEIEQLKKVAVILPNIKAYMLMKTHQTNLKR